MKFLIVHIYLFGRMYQWKLMSRFEGAKFQKTENKVATAIYDATAAFNYYQDNCLQFYDDALQILYWRKNTV